MPGGHPAITQAPGPHSEQVHLGVIVGLDGVHQEMSRYVPMLTRRQFLGGAASAASAAGPPGGAGTKHPLPPEGEIGGFVSRGGAARRGGANPLGPGGADGLPHPFGAGGHVEVANAEVGQPVDHGVLHGWG